jgi:hypothetical protein
MVLGSVIWTAYRLSKPDHQGVFADLFTAFSEPLRGQPHGRPRNTPSQTQSELNSVMTPPMDCQPVTEGPQEEPFHHL